MEVLTKAMNTSSKKANCILVYGSSGRVGSSIVSEAKSKGMFVIGIGRKHTSLVDYHVSSDMANIDEVIDRTEEVFMQFEPMSVVFAHRSRADKSEEDFPNTVQCLSDSLLPVFALRDVIEKTAQKRDVSVVTVGSTVGKSYSNDTDFSYHVNKAAVTSASLMLGYLKSNLRVYSNMVLFGEAKDTRIPEDSRYHSSLYNSISTTLNKPVSTIQSISRLCVILAAHAADLQISGQELIVDSGLSKMNIESLFRRAAHNE